MIRPQTAGKHTSVQLHSAIFNLALSDGTLTEATKSRERYIFYRFRVARRAVLLCGGTYRENLSQVYA